VYAYRGALYDLVTTFDDGPFGSPATVEELVELEAGLGDVHLVGALACSVQEVLEAFPVQRPEELVSVERWLWRLGSLLSVGAHAGPSVHRRAACMHTSSALGCDLHVLRVERWLQDWGTLTDRVRVEGS